jgi:hypothetical protein
VPVREQHYQQSSGKRSQRQGKLSAPRPAWHFNASGTNHRETICDQHLALAQ